MNSQHLQFFATSKNLKPAIDAGFRFGYVGTHTSRTIMLQEIVTLLETVPDTARPTDYADAIVENNCLGKQTIATRRHSLQHLRELYSLDPTVPIFRIFRRLWADDQQSAPVLALLVSLARDPLLMSTAEAVIALPDGAEFQRSAMHTALVKAVGDRLLESTLEKVMRNAASSWSQSGHLEGRTFKIRHRLSAKPAAVAFAMYMAQAAGFQGEEILTSGWLKVLDCGSSEALELATLAKRSGLLDLKMAGGVFELKLDRLDPAMHENMRGA